MTSRYYEGRMIKMTKITYGANNYDYFLDNLDQLVAVAKQIIHVKESNTYIYALAGGKLARYTYDDVRNIPLTLEIEDISDLHKQYKEKYIA